jgi:hypothetical protein
LRISFSLRLRRVTFVRAQRQCGEKVVDLAFNPSAFATNDARSGKLTLAHHSPYGRKAESDLISKTCTILAKAARPVRRPVIKVRFDKDHALANRE